MFESLAPMVRISLQRFAQHDNAGPYKKNREENKFSSRVEVRVVTPKKFGGC
jgi:hypothetical protein